MCHSMFEKDWKKKKKNKEQEIRIKNGNILIGGEEQNDIYSLTNVTCQCHPAFIHLKFQFLKKAILGKKRVFYSWFTFGTG